MRFANWRADFALQNAPRVLDQDLFHGNYWAPDKKTAVVQIREDHPARN